MRKREMMAVWGLIAASVLLMVWGLFTLLTLEAGGADEGVEAEEAGVYLTESGPVADTPATAYASLEAMEADGVVYTSDIYREDVDLGAEEQELLWMACESTNVPYTLMLALVWRETNYRNLVGDNGASEGYCQVQRKWHNARMERLGVTDLMDPSGNFQVACDYMADLLSRYSTEDALTVYNSGSPGRSAYATAVLNKQSELERG